MIVMVASVTMNPLIRVRTTSNPLTRPIAAPVRMPPRTASHAGSPAAAISQAHTMAHRPVRTPLLRFIWPTLSTAIWDSPMTIGTARNWKTAVRVSPETTAPCVVAASRAYPATARQARVNSVLRTVCCQRPRGCGSAPTVECGVVMRCLLCAGR